MKKLLSLLIVLALTLSIFTGILPASALTTSQLESMKDTTWRADYFYGGMTRDYIINVITNQLWDTYAADQYASTAIAPATEFEQVYNKYFVVETSMLESIRSYLSYDATAGTYTLNYPGGFGGMMPEREYVGYKSLGNNRYALYYQHVTYDILSDSVASQYPGYQTWEPITHNGYTYESGPDGYYRILSYDDYGKMHTVDLNGDVVRFISSADYTNGSSISFDKDPSQIVATHKPTAKPTAAPTAKPTAAPTKAPAVTAEPEITPEATPELTPGPVIQLEKIAETEELVIEISENCFPENVVVSIEKIEDQGKNEVLKETLGDNANKFVAFEITASSENVSVQPNGIVYITFEVPEDYDTNKTLVLYVPVEGLPEIVHSVANEDGTITAHTNHFSTYVLVESVEPVATPDFDGNNSVYWGAGSTSDEVDKDNAQSNTDKPAEEGGSGWIIAVIVIVVLAGGGAVWYFLWYKKKKVAQ